MAQKVDDAGLDLRLRENRLDRFWKAAQAIDHRDQDIVQAAGLQLIEDLEPELEDGEVALAPRPQPQPFEHRKIAGEPDRERGEDDVERDGKAELHAREQKRIEIGHGARPSFGTSSWPGSTHRCPAKAVVMVACTQVVIARLDRAIQESMGTAAPPPLDAPVKPGHDEVGKAVCQ